ncbi:Alpha/Beta hydrolase protein [Elsinoe ampelina]|uniref:Alpha/Beta hydrolase protein n=1 Tax=Elsinoe ampelina TaxID=302913 RepID=A0A6A6G768_9PEZI|nr:Alpha/Beta hydrolase protein [Elsinoe ampelina]
MPDLAQSKRYGPIAQDTYQSISAPGFEGWWHIQGPPGDRTAAKDCDKVIYFIHGGAYVIGNSRTSLVQHLRMAEVCANNKVKLAIFALRYPLAPEATWPAPIEAAVAGYRWLVEHEGIDPRNIIPYGESAGGHLVVALLYEIARQKLEKPGHAVLMFPWLNLHNRSTSFDRNKYLDILGRSSLDDAALAVLPESLREKYKNVLDFSRPSDGHSLKEILPDKTWMSVGSHDRFVDDIIRWTEIARKDGAKVDLEVVPGFAHGGTIARDVFKTTSFLALGPDQDAEGIMPGAEYMASGVLSIL